jgi:hypothetical protein
LRIPSIVTGGIPGQGNTGSARKTIAIIVTEKYSGITKKKEIEIKVQDEAVA